MSETIGVELKRAREQKRMSVIEVSRVTRIPAATLDALEADRFDDLPGEVFVRGFLRAYAQAVGLAPDPVLARYTSTRSVVIVTPLLAASPVTAVRGGNRRLGVAIAFVVLLILVTLALSIVLTPRGHGVPAELSLGRSLGPPQAEAWGRQQTALEDQTSSPPVGGLLADHARGLSRSQSPPNGGLWS